MANGPTRVARGLARDAKKSGVKDYAGPRTGRGPAETRATQRTTNRLTPQTDYSTGPGGRQDISHRGTTGTANRGAELNRRVTATTGSPEAGKAAEMKRARGATKAAMRGVRAGAAADTAAAAAKSAATRAAVGAVARRAGVAGALYTAGSMLKEGYDELQKNPPKRDLRTERTSPARPKR